ncbi:MAG: TonB-dependent receptor [Lentimicrobiaceae bacterium]|nr:TonB-dependent receptor [Lentimicrobiaceae bacterium]
MLKQITSIIIIAVLMPLNLLAQFTISGNVIDKENHEVLIGAHVSLKELNLITVTDNNGNFKFENIKKGTYTLKATYLGFKTYSTDVKVTKDTKINIAMTMEVLMEDEVIVTASRVGDKTPLTYSEIDSEELRRSNQGSDLPFLLQNTPSVVVTSDAGAGVGYTGMRIRGSDLTRINVTLNGIPVNDAESNLVYFVDLPDLASSVDNIQIQRGVGNSSNGAAAFGASINIKTDEQTTEPFARLSSTFGSFNTLKNTINFSSGRNNNGFNFNGRISKINSDGYIDRAYSDLFSYQLSASWSDENDFLKFMIMNGKEETYQAWNGTPKDSLATNPTFNPSGMMYDKDGNFIGYYENEIDKYDQSYYQIHYAHSFSQNMTLTASAFLTTGKGYYENYKNDKSFSSYGLPSFVIGDTVIESVNLIQQKWLDNKYYGFNIAMNHKIGRFDLNYGGSWNRYDGDHFGIINWAEYGVPLNYRWYENNGNKQYYNAFISANYELNGHLNLFAEMQYRHINYSIEGIHDDLNDVTQQHLFNFWNPKGGIFYSINDNNSAYFSVAYSNREPNRDIYTDADEIQRERVTHEKLTDYELGYSYRNRKMALNTNIFYMDYKDQLVMTGEINNVGNTIMTNVDKSYRLGLEGSAAFQFNRYFALDFNFALSQNKILNYVDYVDNYDADWNYLGQIENNLGTTDISFSPNIIGGFNFKVTPINHLDIVFQEKYVGRQYIDNTSTLSRSLDPYFVSNVNINYEWKQTLFKDLNFNLSVNNIFNSKYCSNAWVYKAAVGGEEYIEDGYFSQAGINFMFSVIIGI